MRGSLAAVALGSCLLSSLVAHPTAITKTAPSMRRLQSGGDCSSHRDCTSEEYCDSLRICWTCSYVRDGGGAAPCDAIDGDCSRCALRSGPSPPPEAAAHSDCEEEMGDSEACEMLGPMAAVAAVGIVLVIVVGIVVLLWPLIVCGCAWCICVKPKQKRGLEPKPQAGAACCLIFWLLVLGLHLVTGGVSLSWFWGAFVMIIPFCCDSCCESASAAFRLQSLFSLVVPCRCRARRGRCRRRPDDRDATGQPARPCPRGGRRTGRHAGNPPLRYLTPCTDDPFALG